MNRNRLFVLSLLAMLIVALVVAISPAAAWCHEGCTPGFWKQEQHFYAWPVEQDMLVTDVFDVACLDDEGMLDLNRDGYPDTLLDALNYQGGNSFEEKAEILLRGATAAWLNSETMQYAIPTEFVVRHVNGALFYSCRTGVTSNLINKSELFDRWNNQYCVFSPETPTW
jgi:hypothetical protein